MEAERSLRGSRKIEGREDAEPRSPGVKDARRNMKEDRRRVRRERGDLEEE